MAGILPPRQSRRQFLKAAAAVALSAPAHRASAAWLTRRRSVAVAVSEPPADTTSFLDALDFSPTPISNADSLLVPDGFTTEVLLRFGDVLNPSGDRYGDHNDYLAILPRGEDEGWLWVNHESVTLPLVAGVWKPPLTLAQTADCLRAMGGSAVRLARRPDGRWRPVVPDPRNFRLDGLTSRIRLTGPAAGTSWVRGATRAIGSTSNCGGGITPWGTVCSGEENFQDTWGDLELGDPPLLPIHPELARPPEHYGYIVEIDPDAPYRRRFFKHTALGRFGHENIAFTFTRDGRLAGYMGDDRDKQCLYKFVSRQRYRPDAGDDNRDLLTDGTLFVADTEAGRWLALDPDRQPALRKAGFDRARVCVHTRTAARLVGGTPLPRPEDVEVHPETGEVFVALTAWEARSAVHAEKYFASVAGALARLREADGDAGALEFEWSIFLHGSVDTGLAWPDNLAWTPARHLLASTDFAQKPEPIANSTQALLGNNYLVVIPTVGPTAGQVTRFAVAPRGAEFCSPALTPDLQELWVSVQHPGDGSTQASSWISHWPDGGDAPPRSALAAIHRIRPTG
jgi:secreted PhoX family phosphatase